MPALAGLTLAILSLASLCACQNPGFSGKIDYASCTQCHAGIEDMGPVHDFPCSGCHLPAVLRETPLADHKGIVRNPSDPLTVREFCLPCHEKEIAALENSLHGTAAGIINQTRYLWGAQKSAYPYVYGLSGSLAKLPDSASVITVADPSDLVDDFLRRRCLRCHIHTKGPGGRGLYRATGCAACHMLYGDEGFYGGDDQAIDKSKSGYPIKHSFTRRIPTNQCLRCHNHNHVGADYVGLFEKDYHRMYRVLDKDQETGQLLYGLDHHRLSKDVHLEKGLWCTDCHGSGDVMTGMERKRCSSCHTASDDKDPSGQSGKTILVSRGGMSHRIPPYSKGSTAHGIVSHERVGCSACHAQWSFQDYGLSVIREDLLDAYKWRNLAAQGDPSAQKILDENRDSPVMIYPVSRDWVSGDTKSGLWSMGWRFRRWEPMPLGIDERNQYAVLRPHFQYFISFVDKDGKVILDSVVPSRGDGSGAGWAYMPYSPHSIAPFGRSCDSCHMNRVSAGCGLYDGAFLDTYLMVPSPPAIQGPRLLTLDEQKKLMEPSEGFRKKRLSVLRGAQ